MQEETILEELEQRGYVIRKIVKSTQECTKIVVDDDNNRYFVRCYPLKELFRTPEQKKFINNELTMAENFKKSDLNTCIQFVKRVYTKNSLFMFFVYHRHITLENLLTSKPLNESQIVLILRDLLAILYELRGVGVLHRHLSPDKILVTGNQLKFCAIKYCTSIKKSKYDTDEYLHMLRNQTNLFCIAPEVLLNEFTGFKTQIFSFGVIVYLIIHRTYPFGGTCIDDLKNTYRTSTEKPKINLKLTAELIYMLQKSLQINYADRMSLSEVKLRVGEIYKQIVHEEESIRQKLYNTMTPAIRIDDIPPTKQALREQMFAPNPKKPHPLPLTLPAIGRKKNPLSKDSIVFHGDQLSDRGADGHNSSGMSNPTGDKRRKTPEHLKLLEHRSEKIMVRPICLDLAGAGAANSRRRFENQSFHQQQSA
jgi:serine/threonine protein kinase